MSCYFCEEGKDFSIVKKRYGNIWSYDNEVIFHDDNIFAIVGASPQVVPYILILPYRHIYSVTEMTKQEIISFYKCLNYLCGRGGYGNELCVFEHGGKSEDGSSAIDHCHVHVIDGKYKLFYHNSYDNYTIYNTIPKITGSYLLIGSYKKNKLSLKIATNHIVHERQFFRRRLAEIINEDEWDWHKNFKIDKMLETMRAFT